MDNSLFCNEENVFLMMSPDGTASSEQRQRNLKYFTCSKTYTNNYTSRQDCVEAFEMYLEKELNYMPKEGYAQLLDSDHFISIGRNKAIHWLIQTRRRLNLSLETVSNAVNYFDRFISLNQCNGWKYWMIELLSVACLSTASKFGETSPPALHDIQIEGLDHLFEAKLVKETELKLLQKIEWKLNSTTPYSYLELMILDIDFLMKPMLINDLITRMTELILCAPLLDHRLLAFRPSVITLCLLKCLLKNLIPSTFDTHLTHFLTLIPQDQTDELLKCHQNMTENKIIDYLYNLQHSSDQQYGPSSPVTVLNIVPRVVDEECDPQVDDLFMIMKMPSTDVEAYRKKRKRIEVHE